MEVPPGYRQEIAIERFTENVALPMYQPDFFEAGFCIKLCLPDGNACRLSQLNDAGSSWASIGLSIPLHADKR